MISDKNALEQTYHKLKTLGSKELKVKATEGVGVFIIVSSLVFLALVVAEFLFRFNSVVRTVLFFSWVVVSVLVLLSRVALPIFQITKLKGREYYESAAAKVASYFPEIGDELLNSLQLVTVNSGFTSQAFINKAFDRVYNRVKNIDFGSAVSFSKCFRIMKPAAISGIGVLLIVMVISPLHQAAGRLLLFSKDFQKPQKYLLRVSPGNVELTKGDILPVSVIVLGPPVNKVNLYYKMQEQPSFEKLTINADSLGEYSYQFSNLTSDVEYYAELEGCESERYIAKVIARPVLSSFEVLVNSPAYSGLAPVLQKDNGNVNCLFGSKIHFVINSTKELSSAYLLINDSIKHKLSVSGNTSEGVITANGDMNYEILLTDIQGISTENNISYSVKTYFDSYPSIEITAPAENTVLSSDQRLAILSKISDDFGFSKLLLHYRLSRSEYEQPQEKFSSIEIPISASLKEQIPNYIWNLSVLNLATEDEMTYYLEVFDNDNISGPKSARSSEYTVRVPSVEELFSEAEKKQDEVEQDLLKTMKEAEELKKEIEKLSQDLKKDKKEITWEEKQRIEKSIEKFEELQKQAEDLSSKLDDSRKDLEKNNLLSEKTLQKYRELQELLNEMTSEEMKKAMEKLQQSLMQMDRKQIQQQLENMKFDEETFQKSIERTMNLLKRIQIEQKMDELVKRTEEIRSGQEENLNKENSSQEERNNSAKQQEKTSRQLEELEKEMKDLAEKMKSFDDMPRDEMEKLLEEFDKQKNKELSEQAGQEIRQNKIQQAQQKQQQISRNMQKMSQSMKNLQESMQQQQQMQTLMDMMKMVENIVTLSKEQEALKQNSQQGERTMSFNENARKQESLKRSLQKLLQQMSELSQKTFAITPEMGKELGDAMKSMDMAMGNLQNKMGNQAAQNQNNSMQSMNQAAAMMKNMMDQMMQQGGQGGMMSLMQQLGQLSGQQMMLNNMTQQLQQGNGGQLTPEQQGQLERLAQQQELIRKSMEQLNEEARSTGQSKKLPANMDDIINKMQEVISDMQTSRLDDELIQKQEHILSKMLDAQRSVNERDFEKERESNSGTNITRQSPSELFLNDRRKKDFLKDELNNSLREGYTKDYEELIRRYFEELEKVNNRR